MQDGGGPLLRWQIQRRPHLPPYSVSTGFESATRLFRPHAQSESQQCDILAVLGPQETEPFTRPG